MDIQKILAYQTKDFEIVKLERMLQDNPDKKRMEQISASVKESKLTSAYLEKEAEEAFLQFSNLKKNYEQAVNILNKANSQTDNTSIEESENLITSFNAISNNLSNLEKSLMALADKINGILSDYTSAKNNYAKAKQTYASYKTRYGKLTEEIEPKIKALALDLKELEKGVDKNMLLKYKAKRVDKNFPIIVPIRDNSCGGCMMALPSAQIDKLKRDGYLECENCRRIIYLNN